MELLDYHFFHSLSSEEKAQIEESATKVLVPVNTILYYKGDINTDVLFLKSGSVRIYVQPEEVGSEEMTLYTIEPGEQCLVNLVSTVSSQPALATAQTQSAVEGWLLPREQVLWLIHNSPSYRDFKLEVCSTRITALMNLLSDVKFARVDQRLLNWLYVQGRDSVKVTHEQIATMIGVTRETVSRNLKKLEQNGQVRLGRGVISLL